jgi:hypothetical protein
MTMVSITATSTQDSSKHASTSVPVNPVASVNSVTVSCVPSTVQSGQNSQCTANVVGTGAFNPTVVWTATSGNISLSGLYTAPSVTNATQVAVTATPAQAGAPSSFSSITVNPSAAISSVTVSCVPLTIRSGQTSQCTANVQGTGTFNSAVTWTSTSGSISSSGLYTAPSVTTATQVSVTGSSVQAGAPAGTSSITVNPTLTASELARRLAISSAFRAAIEDDPEVMLPQVALVNAMLTNSAKLPVTALTPALATFRTQIASWEATNLSESELTGQRHAFEVLRQLSVNGVSSGAYTSAVLAADINLLSSVDASGATLTSESAWAQQRNELIDSLLTNTMSNCASQPAYCDSLFSAAAPDLPSVTSSIAGVCASSRAAVVPCQLLQQAAASTMTATGMVTAKDGGQALTGDGLTSASAKAVTPVAQNTQACADKKPDCKFNDKDGKNDAAFATNISNVASTLGKDLGLLTDQQAKEVKTLGSATSTIWTDVGKLSNAWDNKNFNLDDLENQKWINVVGLLFTSADSNSNDGSTLSTALKFATSVGSLLSGMGGSISDLINVFGASKNPNADVLSAIAALKSMIQALQNDMHSQFAIVDARLANLSVAMANGFSLVDDKLNNQNVTLLQIQSAVSDLDSQLSWLATSASADAQSIERANLNLAVLGLLTPVSEDEFAKELAVLTQYITKVSGDATFEGSNYDYTPLGITTTLSEHQSDYNLSYLAGMGQTVLKSRSYGSNLANPTEVLYAGNLYLALIQAYPQFASVQGATIAKQVGVILPVITTINQTTTLIQSDTSLLPNLLTAYSSAISGLQATVNTSTQSYLTSIATSNQNLTSIDLFAGPDQPGISYTPQAVQAGVIPPCGSAPGENLQMVSNWKSLIPTGVLAAEALGVGTIHLCYSLPNIPGNNGWYNLYTYKIKVGEYQAFADLAVTIQVSLNDKTVRSYEVDFPAGLPYGQSGFCFFSNTGQIQVAPGAVPAWTVLGAAWTGIFYGQGTYCSGASVGNLKATFETTAAKSYDWTVSDSASSASNAAAVSNALLKLQSGLNGYVSSQLGTSGSTIASAGQSMTGYRLALNQYLEIAYGNLLNTNIPLQSILNGSNALPTVSTLQAAYITASKQTQLAGAPVDFTTSVSSSEQALLDVVKANSPESYFNPDLAALATKLNLVLASLDASSGNSQ